MLTTPLWSLNLRMLALATGLICLLPPIPLAAEDMTLPELDEIQWFIKQDRPPPGIVFEIREYDEDALYWVGPRLERYVELLRERFPKLPIAVLSHGDEMLSLTEANQDKYQSVHRIAKRLVNHHHVMFHACGSFAEMSGLSADSFPAYIDVVPYGPSQLADYKQVGYEQVSIELTW